MTLYNVLSNKYQFIKENVFNWPDNITGLVYDLGELIVNKVNKTIDSDTIFTAIEIVYKNSYGYSEETLNEKLDEVRKENMERQSKMFPSRFKINQDGTTEIIYDDNKFDGRKL